VIREGERFGGNFLISGENKYLSCKSGGGGGGGGGGTARDLAEWFLSFLTSTGNRALWDCAGAVVTTRPRQLIRLP